MAVDREVVAARLAVLNENLRLLERFAALDLGFRRFSTEVARLLG